MNPITGLLAALGAVTGTYFFVWAKSVLANRQGAAAGASENTDARFPTGTMLGIGALTNFFDTLGIGSYAPTTVLFRLKKIVNDRVIPGTLNVGHTLPTVVQTFIYTRIIAVDFVTLFSMIGAAILGAWLGAGVVAGWPKRNIRLGMGSALLVASTLMLMTQLQLFPGGGEALGVRGISLLIAVVGNFILGSLMTLGIGLYAPCMIMISLLGMSPITAFPIMMGSCAFLMPVGSMRFIREGSYNLRAAMGLMIGGVPAVLAAAFIVESLSLYAVRWLVIVVVVYTAISMLMAGLSEGPEPAGRSVKAEA